MQHVFVTLDSALLGVVNIAANHGLPPTQCITVKEGESAEAAIAAANAAAAALLPPSGLEARSAKCRPANRSSPARLHPTPTSSRSSMSYSESSRRYGTPDSSACSYGCTCANCDATTYRPLLARDNVSTAASTATTRQQPNFHADLGGGHCSEAALCVRAPAAPSQDENVYIKPAELLALVERLPKGGRSVGPIGYLHVLLKVIGDEIKSEDLADICWELAAQGKRWRGYPEALLGCEVLGLSDGTCVVFWGFGGREDSPPELIPATLGDVLNACETDAIPAWFPLDWIQVFDGDDVWRPRCMSKSPLREMGSSTASHAGPVRLH